MQIGIWGDSITYGQGDSEALGWVGRFRKSLRVRDHTYQHEIYNFGVCGDTAQDLLQRFEVEANAIEPDVIVFAVGINDSKYPKDSNTNRVPLPEFKKHMDALLRQAKKFTKKIFVVSATVIDESAKTALGSKFINSEIEKYNKALQELAESHQILFIDVFKTLNFETDLDDGLHPSAQGYQKMFEAIASKISI